MKKQSMIIMNMFESVDHIGYLVSAIFIVLTG